MAAGRRCQESLDSRDSRRRETYTATMSGPAGLGPRGRRLWDETVAACAVLPLDPGERAILGEACRVCDEIERLVAGLADAPLTVAGSKGQPVAHPLIAEVRAHRTNLAVLIGRLDLGKRRASRPRGALAEMRAARERRAS
jgi:hypothetical protein